MIAAGDDVHAGGEQFAGDLGRDAVAAGGVFAVRNDEIERVLVAEAGENVVDGLASGFAHDVADEEKFHAAKLAAGRKEDKPRMDTNEHELVGTARCDRNA